MKFNSITFEINIFYAVMLGLAVVTLSLMLYVLKAPTGYWRYWFEAILWGMPLMLWLTSYCARTLSQRILKPVKEITHLARRITQEDLSVRIKSRNFNREMVVLIESFNAMIDRLQQSFQHVEQFSHHVAHDLKTPLTIIQGEADLLLRRDRCVHEYKQALGIIQEESRRVLKIVDDLLLLTKLDYYHEVFKFEKFDFSEFFYEIVEQNRLLAANKGVGIRMGVLHNDGPLVVNGNRLHLRRLFFSLIDNGIKFSPPGGCVDMHIKQETGKVISFIKDAGPGIDKENLGRMFKDYSCDDVPPTRGQGLGLSIAYTLAKLHLGDIQVESKHGEGTTFKVVLPLQN